MEPPRRPSSCSPAPSSALVDETLLTNMTPGPLSLQIPSLQCHVQQQVRPKQPVSILPRPMPSLADVLLAPRALLEHPASDTNLVVLATLTTAIASWHPEPQTQPRAPARAFSSSVGSSTRSSSEAHLGASSISPNAVPTIAPAPSTLLSSSSAPAATPAAPLGTKVKKKRIRIKTDRRREQCRANQARYRNKQRDQAVVLEEKVLALREEVRELENQRMMLSRSEEVRLSNSNTPTQAVLDFFQVFRHGLRREYAKSDTSGESQDSRDFHEPSSQQSELLGSVLAPDFRFGDFHGVDAFMEQCRRYSAFHDDLVLELLDTLTIDPSTEYANETSAQSIRVAAKITLTITRATIQHVFPHLESAHARIVKKLIGKRVTYNGVFEFEFDTTHKVQRLDVSLDIVASLLELLHNVREVATVLEHARIQQNFYLCDLDTGNLASDS
ncbi:hypothetical protein FI667_g7814, partial [Globisporangium splendens]